MTRVKLLQRVRERLKKIHDTRETGYYAKMYDEDCTLLLSLIESPDGPGWDDEEGKS
jgi:hypothetical protein